MNPPELLTLETLAKDNAGRDQFYYLASPYTNPDPDVVSYNYEQVLIYSWLLHQKGLHHFCPIAHCHEVASRYGMPTDYLFWQEFADCFIIPSRGIIIAAIPGWEQSRGIQHERRRATQLKKPIYLARKNEHTPPSIILSRM